MNVVCSLQVGLPRTYGDPDARDPQDRPWTSAIAKDPVDGPRWLHATHLEGDAQADREHHGGMEMAVLAYAEAHYAAWHAELAPLRLPYGAFGENLTVSGLTEAHVSIGDTFELGEAVVQVSQPRSPCWKLARRWKVPDLAARVQKTGRTGWYLRVLKEGLVAPGQELVLVERPFERFTVALVSRVLAAPHAFEEAAELAACPLLAETWRRRIGRAT